MSFFQELKRRNVVKVGIAYVVASWLLLQLTEVLTELLEIGPEVGKIVIVLLIVGFIPAVICAWAFEMTPEGIKREAEVDRSSSIAPQTGRKLDFVIIGMLVLIASYFIWESRFAEKTTAPDQDQTAETAPAPEFATESAPTTDERTAIVVLPFVNMSADPDQEFFSDGLSEEILNALAQIKDLRVISRTSAFAFKGKDLSIPEIAAQLGVSHVLEGSVRSAGDSVRITAQLIEVDTDSHLWSNAYSREMKNVFDIQEEISLAIADALQITLSAGDVQARPTDNLAAYDAYLRGRHLYQRRENLGTAVGYFNNAVALDPEYAEAWANLAAALLVDAFSEEDGYQDRLSRSRMAAQKAIELDPENGFAHAVLGLHHFRSFDYDSAIEAFEKAIDLAPNESNSYLWMAIALSSLGYVDQSLDYMTKAELIDPVFSNLQNWFTGIYLMTGQYDLAAEHEAKALDLNPAFIGNNVGELAQIDGDINTSERQLLAAYEGSPSAQRLVRAYHAALRDPALVADFTALAEAIDPNPEGGLEKTGYWDSSPFLFHLGEVDAALAVLRERRAEGRGLRVANSLGNLWSARSRDKLSHPSLPAFFEEMGMLEYWRQNGDPDYCRVVGNTVECATE